MNNDPAGPLDLSALSAWAPMLAQTFVSLSSDIALVIDGTGVIRTVVQGSKDPIAPGAQRWIGRAWIDTVSGDTRPKIENLLKDVGTGGVARRREVNHPISADNVIPVAYTAVQLGRDGPILAVGRDLRTIAAIQQRYVDSQQEIERGYWQARQAEARYQLLFHVATDAVLVVDSATLDIVEANTAAGTLFCTSADGLRGLPATSLFETHSESFVSELFANARTTGQSGEMRARLKGSMAPTSVVASPFRTEGAMRLLVRVRAIAATSPTALNQTVARLVDGTTDSVVITDSTGRIMNANKAFVSLTGVAGESEVKGQPLLKWLSSADEPLGLLIAHVRRDGIARGVKCWVTVSNSPARRLDVSATLLTEGDQECIGFIVHSPPPGQTDSHTPDADTEAGAALQSLGRDLDTLGGELGERDFASIMGEAARSVERHFVELAFKRTAGNVEAAASLLGMPAEAFRQLLRHSDPSRDSYPDSSTPGAR